MKRTLGSKLLLAAFMACMLLAPVSVMAKGELQQLAFIESQYSKAMQTGQVRRALEWARQGYDLANQMGVEFMRDFNRMFFAGYVGAAAAGTGDYELARNALIIQRELALRFKIDPQLWNALAGLGTISWRQNRLDEARDWCTQAMAQARRMKDEAAENRSRYNLGLVYKDMGMTDKALASFQASLAFFKKRKDKLGEANTLNSIGLLYLQTKPSLALKHFRQALDLYRELGDESGIAMALQNIGIVYGIMGMPAEAVDYGKQSLAMHQRLGERHGEYQASLLIAINMRNLRRFKEAAEYQAHADFLKRQLGL